MIPSVIGKCDPDHPPNPIQLVAFLANQEIATTRPALICDGATPKLSVGAAAVGADVALGADVDVGDGDDAEVAVADGDASCPALGLAEADAPAEGGVS